MSAGCSIPVMITELTEKIKQFVKFLINLTFTIDEVYVVRVNRRRY
jgi:hypothetical protein